MSSATIRPRFFGAVRGEAIKVSRQLSVWLMAVAGVVVIAIITLAVTSAQDVQGALARDPTSWAYNTREVYGTLFQIGSGIVLLIVGARLIGMEYSSGTIRVVYARGVGRLQFLLAEMLTLAVVGVIALAVYLVVVGAILAALIITWTGSLDSVHQISSAFWDDMQRWALVQGMSMGIAILIAAAAAGIGRGLAFAMAASLAFFPADNFLVILEGLAARATKNDHPWLDISQYQLGPNLNVVLNYLEPSHRARAAFATPLTPVDLTHCLAVIGIYALAFAVVAIVRATRPDVLE
jgi:ABC-2 type transport system permease protein